MNNEQWLSDLMINDWWFMIDDHDVWWLMNMMQWTHD